MISIGGGHGQKYYIPQEIRRGKQDSSVESTHPGSGQPIIDRMSSADVPF